MSVKWWWDPKHRPVRVSNRELWETGPRMPQDPRTRFDFTRKPGLFRSWDWLWVSVAVVAVLGWIVLIVRYC